MPTLVVEDGSGVASANSYIDLTYLDLYVSERGYSITGVASQQEIMCLKAMDYLSWFTDKFKGTKADSSYSLPWPRANVVVFNESFDSNVIPDELKKAQAQLVVEQANGTPLFPAAVTSTNSGLVIQKTIGPLTKKYSASGKGVANPFAPIQMASVMVFLRPLMIKSGLLLETYRL